MDDGVVGLFLFCFYLEKAYDTTWKYGILKDRYAFGLRGPLHIFISKLKKIGILESRWNPPFLSSPVRDGCTSLYVDDFQICYRSSNISIIERQLQLCLNKFQQ